MIRLQFSTAAPSLENWASGIIRRMCHSKFSHVDVDLGVEFDVRGCLLGASDSPKAPIVQGNARGVAVRPYDYQEFGIRRTALVECEPDVEEKFNALVISQLGKPFDSSALHAMTADPLEQEVVRDWRDDDAWFCSEMVVWALERAGFFPYEIIVAKHQISPADLLLMVNSKIQNIHDFWEPMRDRLVLGKKEL